MDGVTHVDGCSTSSLLGHRFKRKLKNYLQQSVGDGLTYRVDKKHNTTSIKEKQWLPN